MSVYEKALLDPASAFTSPEQVLTSAELSREQKIEILHRWEYDVPSWRWPRKRICSPIPISRTSWTRSCAVSMPWAPGSMPPVPHRPNRVARNDGVQGTAVLFPGFQQRPLRRPPGESGQKLLLVIAAGEAIRPRKMPGVWTPLVCARRCRDRGADRAARGHAPLVGSCPRPR
jgi:hypothetical protein